MDNEKNCAPLFVKKLLREGVTLLCQAMMVPANDSATT